MRFIKILKIISYTILTFAFLSIFAYSVKLIEQSQNQGIFTKAFKKFIYFPIIARDALQGIKDQEKLVNIDPNFKQINKLKYDLYSLNAYYQISENAWVIQLLNLKNDSIIHKWFFKKNSFFLTDLRFSNSRCLSPILLDNRSIIAMNHVTNNLYRLDKESNIVWLNTDKIYHHTMNLADDGNIWVCSCELTYAKMPNKSIIKYWDNSITKVDINTGKILYDKSISEILIANGYPYLVYGMGNSEIPAGNDPLHLNDIEPALFDGKYWNKGDLFISLRNRSLIILYRPETNKIIRLIQGPFFNQHDVDIISESQISIFNNNISTMDTVSSSGTETEELNKQIVFKISEVLIYDFSDSSFYSYMDQQFKSEQIYTTTEGLSSILSNGDIFIESQNNGKMYILNSKEVLLRRYMNPIKDGLTQMPNWTRIYENINF